MDRHPLQTSSVLSTIPHEVENQINSLITDNGKLVVAPDHMQYFTVMSWSAIGIDGFDRGEFILEDAADFVHLEGILRSTALQFCKSLGNIHVDCNVIEAIVESERKA